jgi:hypothetical protein
MREQGLSCIRDVRARYDGRKRSPYDEAECGHHYARAMASWAAVLALEGFHYSGVTKTMTFAARDGVHFWSNGHAWGRCEFRANEKKTRVRLAVRGGELQLDRFRVKGLGEHRLAAGRRLRSGDEIRFTVEA